MPYRLGDRQRPLDSRKLSEVRYKIMPLRPVKINHEGTEYVQLKGGEHVEMAPDEEPTGHWIHFERREIQPGETYPHLHHHGHILEHRAFPEGQTHRVVGILHNHDGEHEFHHYGHDGVPMHQLPQVDEVE